MFLYIKTSIKAKAHFVYNTMKLIRLEYDKPHAIYEPQQGVEQSLNSKRIKTPTNKLEVGRYA